MLCKINNHMANKSYSFTKNNFCGQMYNIIKMLENFLRFFLLR